MEIALAAIRVHGGYGYSTEFDVERYFRDAPLMIVGEGANEIQRNVIAGQLIARDCRALLQPGTIWCRSPLPRFGRLRHQVRRLGNDRIRTRVQ